MAQFWWVCKLIDRYMVVSRLFFVFVFYLSSSLLIANGQTLSTTNKKAIKYYDESRTQLASRQFDEAIESLNQAINKDPAFAEAYIRLASIYKSLLDTEMAYQNYLVVAELYPDSRKYSSVYFNLGTYEFSQGSYAVAKGHIILYLKYKTSVDKNKVLAEQMLRNCEFALANMSNGFQFNPRPLPNTVNNFEMQYFPLLTVDQSQLIYVVREQDEEIMISNKEGEYWLPPVSISQNINTEFNEGTCSISAVGRILVFTSCMGRKGYGSCDLFISTKQGDEWSEPVNLGDNINSTAWDSQPSLSADGRTLYFVSNRSGGLGMRDVWVSKKDEDGYWSPAVNLGSGVNTSRDDISPFIHPNNQRLYFAANGRLGFGGFDIYFAELGADGQWGNVTNFGYPINTHDDQVSMFISADGSKGYYSNEALLNNHRSSKLYEIDIPPVLQVENKSSYVTGVVKDANSDELLMADVRLMDIQTQSEVLQVSSDSVTGAYFMVLTEGAEYALYVEKPGYLFKSYHFNYVDSTDVVKPIEIDILLDKISSGAQIVLNNIFFEFDSYALDEKSKVELGQVITFLNANPEVEIMITGYTDNIGSEQYNLNLSRSRALAVVDFLKESGVDNPGRLLSRGLGSQNPLVPNDSESHRQMNRRIEFMIR